MSKLAIALSTLIAVSALWAVSLGETAHGRLWSSEPSRDSNAGSSVIVSTRLKESRSRGLLVNVWIRNTGPYIFAVDTGAGLSLVTNDLVSRAQLETRPSHLTLAGGLGSGRINSKLKATLQRIALGHPTNRLQTSFTAAVVARLPDGIDGILDPTEAFQPFGYSIDLPNRELRVVDFNGNGLQLANAPKEGATVKWIRKSNDHRPFVRLGDGRLALIDTGSGFGLAVSDGRVVGTNQQEQTRVITDLGGGSISARRVSPVSVNIGSLVLQSVPTDVLFGAPAGTPVIIGRDALYPFRLTFDPTTRLIEISPSEEQ